MAPALEIAVEPVCEPVAEMNDTKEIPEPISVEDKKIDEPVPTEERDVNPEVVMPEAAPVEPEAKPSHLLEVIAREVEGRSWSEHLRPSPSPLPARRVETETGAGRAAARAAAPAALEEFEVLGAHHRQNALYPLAQCSEESGF